MNALTGMLGTGAPLRQLPENLEMEQALLGACLTYAKAPAEAAAVIGPADFANGAHAAIFASITKIASAGGRPDALTVGADLGDAALEAVSGRGYLAQLMSCCPGPGVAAGYAEVVRGLALRRAIIEQCGVAMEAAYAPPDGGAADEVLANTVSALLELSETGGGAGAAASLGDAVDDAFARAEDAHRGRRSAVSTGLPTLDRLTGGFAPKHLIFLMARSGSGKSSVAMQITKNVARDLLRNKKQDEKQSGIVHYISMEMPCADVGAVQLAAETGISVEDLNAGRIGAPENWVRADSIRKELATLPILIDDAPSLDIDRLVMRARAVAQRHKTKLLVIDYFELVGRSRDTSRLSLLEWNQRLGYTLKSLAKTIGAPVVALRQVNKARDREDDKRPTLTDLPFDGGQAADLVLALHRPEKYLGECPSPSIGQSAEARARAIADWERARAEVAGILEAIVLKRRFGGTGLARLRWDGPRMSVAELA